VLLYAIVLFIIALPGWGGDAVGLLVGSSRGSKTPAARRSRELLPLGAHWEAEGGQVVEGWGRGTGWR
jgi:hypothetical protein